MAQTAGNRSLGKMERNDIGYYTHQRCGTIITSLKQENAMKNQIQRIRDLGNKK